MGRASAHGPFSSPAPRQSARPRAPEVLQCHWRGWHRQGGQALRLSPCSLCPAAARSHSQPGEPRVLSGACPPSLLGNSPGGGSLGQGGALCLKEPLALGAPVVPTPRRPLSLCPDTLGKEGPAGSPGTWFRPGSRVTLERSLSLSCRACSLVLPSKVCQEADRWHSAHGAATAGNLPELGFC